MYVCVCVCTVVCVEKERDIRADLPNGWSDLCVFGCSTNLISSMALIPQLLCFCFSGSKLNLFLFSSVPPSSSTVPTSYRSRLLPELVESPNSGPTEWRRSDWMQAQDVSLGCDLMEEREGSPEREPQVLGLFAYSKCTVCVSFACLTYRIVFHWLFLFLPTWYSWWQSVKNRATVWHSLNCITHSVLYHFCNLHFLELNCISTAILAGLKAGFCTVYLR